MAFMEPYFFLNLVAYKEYSLKNNSQTSVLKHLPSRIVRLSTKLFTEKNVSVVEQNFSSQPNNLFMPKPGNKMIQFLNKLLLKQPSGMNEVREPRFHCIKISTTTKRYLSLQWTAPLLLAFSLPLFKVNPWWLFLYLWQGGQKVNKGYLDYAFPKTTKSQAWLIAIGQFFL